MAGESEVHVSQLLDEQGLRAFHIKLIAWSTLIALIDGYDIGAVAFAAPHLIQSWHVPPKSLGLVLTASNFGVLFGSQIFGWVGDRYGRKTSLIACNLLFGVFTWWAAYATDLTGLFILRTIAGLGIGGVIPNVVAINAESAPRHLRATLAIIATGMVPIGGALAGFAAAAFIPHYGWPVLFHIGGVVPIVLAIAAMFGMPESIKYMALHESHRSKMERLIAAIRPGYKVPANARFVIEDEQQFPSSHPRYLFRNGLEVITPLTWLIFVLNLMGYFFLISWTPTMLVAAAHASQTVAALTGAGLQVGGTVGALVLCWWLQRQRFFAIAILFVIAVPVVGAIGYAGLSSTSALVAMAFLAGAVVLGIQTGINVVGAMIYPTSLRANGSGWQLGLGRFGAIIGPLAGTLLVALPIQWMYLCAAVPFALGAVVTFIIHALNQARLRAHPELAKGQ
jgi:AAHS family 4-hydroxybenzoate transporter-like MFS transporter